MHNGVISIPLDSSNKYTVNEAQRIIDDIFVVENKSRNTSSIELINFDVQCSNIINHINLDNPELMIESLEVQTARILPGNKLKRSLSDRLQNTYFFETVLLCKVSFDTFVNTLRRIDTVCERAFTFLAESSKKEVVEVADAKIYPRPYVGIAKIKRQPQPSLYRTARASTTVSPYQERIEQKPKYTKYQYVSKEIPQTSISIPETEQEEVEKIQVKEVIHVVPEIQKREAIQYENVAQNQTKKTSSINTCIQVLAILYVEIWYGRRSNNIDSN